MQSGEISRNSHMWHFQFSIWLKCSFREVHFAENPHLNRSSGSKVMSNWRIHRTIENNWNSFFLAVSHNQCCRLLTDPARSHHIYIFTSSGVGGRKHDMLRVQMFKPRNFVVLLNRMIYSLFLLRIASSPFEIKLLEDFKFIVWNQSSLRF